MAWPHAHIRMFVYSRAHIDVHMYVCIVASTISCAHVGTLFCFIVSSNCTLMG